MKRDRPGGPPKDTRNTEHILVSKELKEGLEFLRYTYKRESYGDVVLKLFQAHLFILWCTEFMRQLTILNKRDNETESFDRMIKCKPRKLKLSPTPLWPDGQDLDIRTLEAFINSGRYK